MSEIVQDPAVQILAVGDDTPFAPLARDEAYYTLRREAEEFLYDEAELLDSRRFKDWINMLADDLIYFMPMTFNVKYGEHEQRERTRYQKEMSWFNEGKWTLNKRVEQIETGVHWAEEPLSRLSRVVSNVQVTGVRKSVAGHEEIAVRNAFVTYQNRCEHEEYLFVGKRYDVLRREEGEWKLARREIHLGQNVLLAKNLSIFL